MNWKSGFTARYFMELVDAATWRDIRRYEITGGNISKSNGGLMEAADINATEVPATGDVWVRIYLDARQGETGAREAIFTGLFSAPATDWVGSSKEYKAECYSVLKPASDILLQRGWYAPAGISGAKQAAKLLSVGAAPVTYEENAPALASMIIAEAGETNLSMAQKIINAIDWRIRITGMGEIQICPKAAEPVATFDALENDLIELSVSDSSDWFNCPNVFRATSGDMTAVARDDDPESPFSTVARGREIWMEENDCKLAENEGIGNYARRRLKEEQSPTRQVSYARRFVPDIYVGDIIRLQHPAQGIDGEFKINMQKIDLGYGGRTSEEAENGY